MKLVSAIISMLIAQAAGALGAVFTASGVRTWYVDLVKPSWNPPSWVFGPVWTTLYALMGIAAWLVWERRELPGAKLALWVYGVHLVFNMLWSVLFFGLRNPAFAFFEILLLLGFIIVTTVLFWRITPWAALLLLPYLVWVAFASYLNFTIWQLN